MLKLIIVMLGGALGSGARHLVNVAAMRVAGPNFPWGTVTVNLVGALLMGIVTGLLARFTPEGGVGHLRLFLATGVLGGFTTFSAFTLDAQVLWQRGALLEAAIYVLGSVLLGLLALVAGLALVRVFG